MDARQTVLLLLASTLMVPMLAPPLLHRIRAAAGLLTDGRGRPSGGLPTRGFGAFSMEGYGDEIGPFGPAPHRPTPGAGAATPGSGGSSSSLITVSEHMHDLPRQLARALSFAAANPLLPIALSSKQHVDRNRPLDLSRIVAIIGYEASNAAMGVASLALGLVTLNKGTGTGPLRL